MRQTTSRVPASSRTSHQSAIPASLLTLALLGGVWWPIPLWTGAIFLSGAGQETATGLSGMRSNMLLDKLQSLMLVLLYYLEHNILR
jgi:hypothetical protein